MWGVRKALARQQTWRDALRWSYDLLTAEEQRLFRRLCVFVGGCTLEAVETVCAALPDGVGQALEGVTSLLDKSLLQQSEHEAGEPRLSMLETLREYGLDCLHQSTEAEAIQGAHANYYLSPPYPKRVMYSFDEVLDKDEGWARFNRHYWLRDYRGFLEFFMSQIFTEPHSTRQIEDCVGWGLETTPEVLIATDAAPSVVSKENVEDFVRRVRCPVLIFHGDEDALVPYTRSTRLAELTGGTLVTIEGGGHYPQG